MNKLNTFKSTLLLIISCLVFSVTTLSAQSHILNYVGEWGKKGSGDGEFTPSGIAIENHKYMYVLDKGNNRIHKYDYNGVFIENWGGIQPGGIRNPNIDYHLPMGITMHQGNKHFYMADTYTHQVRFISPDGTPLTKWGSLGSEKGQFYSPMQVAIDKVGNAYVADADNNRIQKFTSMGKFIKAWGYRGPADGAFSSRPTGIAIDSHENVYVVAGENIQKFTSDGTFMTKWKKHGGNGIFQGICQLAIDDSNNIYVTDSDNHAVQKYKNDGTFLGQWGKYGSGKGEFKNPIGITVDKNGYVYVADQLNYRIQKFATAKSQLNPANLSGKTFYIKNTYGGSSHESYGALLSWDNAQPHPVATVEKDDPVKWRFEAVSGKANTYKIVNTYPGAWKDASISWDSGGSYPTISVEFNDPVEWRMDPVPGKANHFKIVNTYPGKWNGASISWDWLNASKLKATLESDDPVEWELVPAN